MSESRRTLVEAITAAFEKHDPEEWRPGPLSDFIEEAMGDSLAIEAEAETVDAAVLRLAYTLLCSVEPALIRAVKQSPNETAERLNQSLLDGVRGWTDTYRLAREYRDGGAA